MKYLQNYSKFNEGIKNTIAGIGLIGSLLSTNDLKSSNTIPDSMMYMNELPSDKTKITNYVSKLSDLRKEHFNDSNLDSIIQEIKSNINTNDSTKFKEMFGKLSSHLENEYGYTIDVRKIDIDRSSIKEEPKESNFFYIMGWLGSLCLALCGVPQALQSYKDKNSHGISWGMLLLWAFGEVFALTYVFNKLDMPLLMNYAINIFVVALMLYYKVNPSTDTTEQ